LRRSTDRSLTSFAAAVVLAAALGSSAAPAAADTAPAKRRGPDLLHHWKTEVRNLGSIELTGSIEGADGERLLVEGRFGPGAIMVDLSADTLSSNRAPEWTAHVRTDGLEAEVEEDATGWARRRAVSEVRLPIAEGGDLFGLLEPVGAPSFRGENERGEQVWEYSVRGGSTYRVWLAAPGWEAAPPPSAGISAPLRGGAAASLRMIRRDVIHPGGSTTTTFLYRDFFQLRPGLGIPREIIAESGAGERLLLIRASRLSTAPPIPRLQPLSPPDRALYRAAERISSDTATIQIARRIATGTTADEAPALLDSIRRLEDSFGVHPLLDLLRARVALAGFDTLLAGAAVRAAASFGRPALELSARVGAVEFLETGDSSLLDWALRRALPARPDELTEADERTLARVIGVVAEVFIATGETEAALAALERAASYSPGNRAIAALRVNTFLDLGDESRAVRAARWVVRARPEDERVALELGDLLESLGRVPEVEALYRSRISGAPQEPEWRLRLGLLLLRTGRWVEAEDEYDSLIRWMESTEMTASRRADLANEIAYALAESHVAIPKAKRLVEYALTVDPADPYYLDTLGLVLWRQRNRMAAIMTFERALQVMDNPRIRAHLVAARR
jgi:tetratricopeptide (TPR) repeat protein